MASLAEIVRSQTSLRQSEINHLQRLLAGWNMLADFCFSDLLLFVPVAAVADGHGHGDDGDGDGDGDAEPTTAEVDELQLVLAGHVRPSTTQTLYRHDMIGEVFGGDERPLVARSLAREEIIEGEITVTAIRERVRVLCIPVRHDGRTIAVLSRESTPSVGRSPGELERTYVDIFNRFAQMIAKGTYPYPIDDSDSKESPRVGDGVVVLDRAMCVEYASPNAVSALHRMGVHTATLFAEASNSAKGLMADPWCRTQSRRQRNHRVRTSRAPKNSAGVHSASWSLLFGPSSSLPGYNAMAVSGAARHGRLCVGAIRLRECHYDL